MGQDVNGVAPAAATGVLLVNLGTTASPSTRDVRRYLREFLSDPRVLDMPALVRFLFLHVVILPFRPRKTASAYAKIWTEAGSPLLVHSRALRDRVERELGADYVVELAMRYGAPSIADALARLRDKQVAKIVIVPLYPQAAASSTSSSLARVFELLGSEWEVPPIATVAPFFNAPGFVDAVADTARDRLAAFAADHILFSYHSLPERQILRGVPAEARCFTAGCCAALGPENRGCYRAQCFETTRLLCTALELDPELCTTSFQSRLGRTPWIGPNTVDVLDRLAAQGIARLAVLTPAFVADNLETLEEIGIRARAQWQEAGGEELLLVPCVNASEPWTRALAGLIRDAG